jgi:NAD kinase
MIRILSLLSVRSNHFIILIGGDSSYLRAAGLIHSRNIPILGINSDPTRRTGALLNAEIDFKNQDIQIPRLLEDICAQNFEYFYRTRALFEIENHMNGTVT